MVWALLAALFILDYLLWLLKWIEKEMWKEGKHLHSLLFLHSYGKYQNSDVSTTLGTFEELYNSGWASPLSHAPFLGSCPVFLVHSNAPFNAMDSLDLQWFFFQSISVLYPTAEWWQALVWILQLPVSLKLQTAQPQTVCHNHGIGNFEWMKARWFLQVLNLWSWNSHNIYFNQQTKQFPVKKD